MPMIKILKGISLRRKSNDGQQQSSSSSLLLSSSHHRRRPQWPPLLKLAKQRKFTEIISIFEQQAGCDEDIFEWLNYNGSDGMESLSSFRGDTPLHTIMSFRPPVEVVDLLSRYLSKQKGGHHIPEEAVDMQGRTPLHIAASEGCHVSVVKRLLNGDACVLPAVTKDSNGRCPIHLACANPLGLSSSSSSLSSGGGSGSSHHSRSSSHSEQDLRNINNMVDIVRILIRAYPEAVGIKDDSGLTPLDHAQRNNADPRILHAIESAKLHFTKPTVSSTAYSNDGTTADSTIILIVGGGESGAGVDENQESMSSIGLDGVTSIPWIQQQPPPPPPPQRTTELLPPKRATTTTSKTRLKPYEFEM